MAHSIGRRMTETTEFKWIQEISESDARTSYPVTRILVDCHTEFCDSVIIADSAIYGRMLFLDGELQSASADEHIYHESLVHPIMSVTKAASRVLVVGGGEGATVREVLKWAPLRVDWVDIDGELVDLCRKHLRWDTVSSPDDARADCTVFTHSAVHYQSTDICDALPTLGQFDAIILDLPDPDGETGYLYSPEFWTHLTMHLAPSGKIVTHCGPVRPFGQIGEGYQRMPSSLSSLSSPSLSLNRTFYAQTIPSFQGEWGFMVYGYGDRDLTSNEYPLSDKPLPPGLRVVDSAQLRTWFGGGSMLWRNATHK